MAAPDANERLTSGLRFAVAVAALAIFFADPSEHPERRALATAVLALFAVYAAAEYAIAIHRERSVPLSVAPWIDVIWVTAAVGVSQATSGVFYPLYLFAILCASFWGGFRRGFTVTVVSALAFATVGVMTAPAGVDLRLFLARPLYLLVLGYLTAVWGGHEVRSRRRLGLLRDVTTLANPRFGVEPTIGRIVEAIRAYYRADSCRLIVADELSGRTWMRTAVRGRGSDAAAATLPPEVAQALLPVPPDATFLVRMLLGRRVAIAIHAPGTPQVGDSAMGEALLTAFDAGALIGVPFRYHATAPGRLWVARDMLRPFDDADAEFLGQVVDQVVPVLQNLRLVDHLASDAAKEERRRIALDLHDSVIQPYLGLRLGLSAARAALGGGRGDEAAAHLDRLVDLADGEIQTLRGYVRDLRASAIAEGAGLEAAVRRFCRRFSDATGVRVEVTTAGPPIADRLGAEVFQMVAEALSNVRRHTAAARDEVRIETVDGQLRVTVANDGAPADPAPFFPRSLGERAAALGGNLTIEHPARGTTAVHLQIPI
jgi:signal transduction histidine kinase